jgi:hypothetical protein
MKSLLHHAFGVKGFRCLRARYEGGKDDPVNTLRLSTIDQQSLLSIVPQAKDCHGQRCFAICVIRDRQPEHALGSMCQSESDRF